MAVKEKDRTMTNEGLASAGIRVKMEDSPNPLPPLTSEDYDSLAASIAEDGSVHVPIEISPDGRIIDGRARYEIAEKYNIGCSYFVRADLTDEQMYERALSLNLARRHLGIKERKEIAAVLLRATPYKSSRAIAGLTGLNDKTITAIREEMITAGEIKAGDFVVSLSGQVRRLIRRPTLLAQGKGELETALEITNKMPPDQLPNKIIGIRRGGRIMREYESRMALENPEPLPELPLSLDIREEKFQTALDDIPSETVGLIVTDPPWGTSWSEWSDLGDLGQRLLKPGGAFICLCGHSALPAAMDGLRHHLNYNWLLAIRLGGAHAPNYPAKMTSFFTPVLYFSKAAHRHIGMPPDFIESEEGMIIEGSGEEKTYHIWQQGLSEIKVLVEKFSCPGDLVVDPCLGGGTTAVAAHELGRRFIGCDRDPAAIQATKRRLAM